MRDAIEIRLQMLVRSLPGAQCLEKARKRLGHTILSQARIPKQPH
jgi:hypothetical protein